MRNSIFLLLLAISFTSCNSLFHHERNRYKLGQRYGCGDNVTWVLSKDGELRIEGTGMMNDFHDGAPWFPYRKKIKKVEIEVGVTSIGNEAFKFCTSLSSVAIPCSVTSIGEEAFMGCGESFSSITIPSSVKSIGEGALSGCSIRSIIIPSSVRKIEDAVFRFCTSLSSVTIPCNVTSIGYDAFRGCSTLSSITIPSSVTSIGNRAFDGCFMTSANIHNNSGVELSTKGLTICDTEQSDGLMIKDNSAVGCRGWAKSVTIPSSVTSIEEWAFADCPTLSSVIIPSNVECIKQGAFSDCSNLTSVTNLSVKPQNISKKTFTNYGTLHVLPGCKQVYESAAYWKNFTIMEDAKVLPKNP